jgi:hypothetical protein
LHEKTYSLIRLKDIGPSCDILTVDFIAADYLEQGWGLELPASKAVGG